jgi:hypothetical protein
VRRTEAAVGQEAPFDRGRQQMKLLADLEVTTKSVERTAEAIGANIAAREQEEIQRAVQLDLPIVVGKPVPILYAQMDGTGIPAVKIETAEEFGKRIYVEAWKRGWSRAEKKVVMGDGAEWIWNLAEQHFPGAVQIVDLYHARQSRGGREDSR